MSEDLEGEIEDLRDDLGELRSLMERVLPALLVGRAVRAAVGFGQGDATGTVVAADGWGGIRVKSADGSEKSASVLSLKEVQ